MSSYITVTQGILGSTRSFNLLEADVTLRSGADGSAEFILPYSEDGYFMTDNALTYSMYLSMPQHAMFLESLMVPGQSFLRDLCVLAVDESDTFMSVIYQT